MSGFWVAGFWAAGFWSEGFWWEVAQPAVQPADGGAVIRHRQGRRRRLHPELPEVDWPPILPEILPPFIPEPLPSLAPRIRARHVRDAETVVFLAP